MLQKLLLAIFAMIASVVMTFVPVSHAAVIPVWVNDAQTGGASSYLPYNGIVATVQNIDAHVLASRYKIYLKTNAGFKIYASDQTFKMYVSYDDYYQKHILTAVGTQSGQKLYYYQLGDDGSVTDSSYYTISTGTTELGYTNSTQNTYFVVPKTAAVPISYTANITSIKTTSARLELSKEYAYYHVRLNSVAIPDIEGLKYWVTISDFSANPKAYIDFSNLTKNTQYTAYVEGTNTYTGTGWTINNNEKPFTFNTPLDDNYVITVSHNGQIWNSAGTTNFTPLTNLNVNLSGYTSAKVSVNGTSLTDLVTGDNVIQSSVIGPLAKVNNQNELILTAMRSDGSTATTKYYFVTVDFNVPPTQGGGNTSSGQVPTQPTAPDSSWDLIGWVKYLVDWVIYLVKILVYMLSQMGSMLSEIANTSTGFIAILTSFFSFLPKEVTVVMVVGLTAAVILRFVAR